MLQEDSIEFETELFFKIQNIEEARTILRSEIQN